MSLIKIDDYKIISPDHVLWAEKNDGTIRLTYKDGTWDEVKDEHGHIWMLLTSSTNRIGSYGRIQ